MEFNGEFNVLAKTEKGDENVITVSPDNGDGRFLFIGPGPHTRSVVLPEDPLSGDKRGSSAFSFSPTANTKVTFEQGDLEVIAEAAATLDGTVPKDDMFDYGYYPESSADLNMRLQDGIQLYPENTELYGKRATMEWVGDVTVSRMVVVNGSETTEAQSAVDFSLRTPFGIDDFEGSLRENRNNGSSDVEADGPTNLSTPATLLLDRQLAILGPPPLNEFGSEFNDFEVDVRASARVWTSGPSGATFQAEVTMQVNNIRLQRVTLEEDGIEIPLSQLKSISSSGYDWIGNGEPDISGHYWINEQGGVFGVADNWSDENNNEQADDVPGSADKAVFNFPGAYSVVQSQPQALSEMIITGDGSAVTFNPDGNNFVTGDMFIGYSDGDNATFTPSGSTFRVGDDLVIGRGGTGKLQIMDAIDMEVFDLYLRSPSSSLVLQGRAEETLLNVESRFIVEAGSVVVEGLESGALNLLPHLSLADPDDSLTSGQMWPGTSLTLTNGGTLLAAESLFTIGTTGTNATDRSAPIATVLIEGGTQIPDSPTLPFQASSLAGLGSSLTVGDLSPGRVTVRNGGFFGFQILFEEEYENPDNQVLFIGTDANGEVLVEGIDSTSGTRSKVQADIVNFNGFSSVNDSPVPASMTVRDGAHANVTYFDLLAEGSGLFVNGRSNGVKATIEVGRRITTNGGLIEAEDGGEITFLETMDIDAKERARLLVKSGGSVVGPIEPAENEASKISFRHNGAVDQVMLEVDGVDATDGTPSLFEYQGDSEFAISFGSDEGVAGAAVGRVTNGGQLRATTGGVNVGIDLNSEYSGNGKLVVSGVDSGTEARARVATKFLEIGSGDGRGLLEISDGGQVEAETGSIYGGSLATVGPDTGGVVSSLTLTDFLLVGNAVDEDERNPGDGELILQNGMVDVLGDLLVKPNGIIAGVGTFNVEGVVSNEGYIDPGLSPGTLTINGDFEQTATGIIVLEINLDNPADSDHLIINGDATIAGTILLVFSGSAPSAEEMLASVEVSGTATPNDLRIETAGLQPGFTARVESTGGAISVVAENDGNLLTVDDPIQLLESAYSLDSGLHISLFGIDQVSYRFESSTDMTNWELISKVTGENNLLEFRNLLPDGESRRFYRVVQDPAN